MIRLPAHREKEAERKLALMDAEFKLPGEAATLRPDYRGCSTAAEAAWVRKGGDLAEFRRLTDTQAQAAQRQAFASTPGLQTLSTHVPADHERAMLKGGVPAQAVKYAGCQSSDDFRQVRDRHDRLDAASPEMRFLARTPVSQRDCSPQLKADVRKLRADLEDHGERLARLAT